MQKITKVDLNLFLSDDQNQQKEFIQQAGAAFRDIGFLALKGHFLDEELQNDLYNEIKAFLILEKKLKASTK